MRSATLSRGSDRLLTNGIEELFLKLSVAHALCPCRVTPEVGGGMGGWIGGGVGGGVGGWLGGWMPGMDGGDPRILRSYGCRTCPVHVQYMSVIYNTFIGLTGMFFL